MGFKEVLERVSGFFNRESGTKISPHEVELRSYLKREHEDRIKRLVHHYRLKDSKDLILGRKINSGAAILKSGNVFKQQSTLNRGRRLL
jgi:hypothetical protein